MKILKKSFRLNGLVTVISSGYIDFDLETAVMHKVAEDPDYDFEAITCAARPVEFSIVNQLYTLDKQAVIEACDLCNQSKQIGVLSTDKYHLILTPFVERHTFFGKDQAKKLTKDVIEECKFLGVQMLRITQFCMMRGYMPFYDQFKGIIEALIERENSPLSLVYFDVPEKNFEQLVTLFQSYEEIYNVNS